MIYATCFLGMAGSLFLLSMVARLTNDPLFLWAAGVAGGLYAAAMYLEAVQNRPGLGGMFAALDKLIRTNVNRFYAWQNKRARARAAAKAAKASAQPDDVWPSEPPKAPPFRSSFDPDDKPKQAKTPKENMPSITIPFSGRSLRESVIEFAQVCGYTPYEGENGGYLLRDRNGVYYTCNFA